MASYSLWPSICPLFLLQHGIFTPPDRLSAPCSFCNMASYSFWPSICPCFFCNMASYSLWPSIYSLFLLQHGIFTLSDRLSAPCSLCNTASYSLYLTVYLPPVPSATWHHIHSIWPSICPPPPPPPPACSFCNMAKVADPQQIFAGSLGCRFISSCVLMRVTWERDAIPRYVSHRCIFRMIRSRFTFRVLFSPLLSHRYFSSRWPYIIKRHRE